MALFEEQKTRKAFSSSLQDEKKTPSTARAADTDRDEAVIERKRTREREVMEKKGRKERKC